MQINSNNYKQLTVFVLVLVGISTFVAYLLFFYLYEAFSKLPVFIQIIVSIPTPSAIYAILSFLFDRYLWKWSALKSIGLVVVDDLSGKWEGVIKSSWDNFATDFPAELLIKQTATSIRIHGKFNQSRSVSIYEHFGRSEMYNQTILYYFYKNDPNYDAPKTMATHEGSTILGFNKENGELSGYYYSGRDRHNHGTISLKKSSNFKNKQDK